MLRVFDVRDLFKPVKMSLRTWSKKTHDPKRLLTRLMVFNSGPNRENRKIFERKADPQGQYLILLIDRDSANAIRVSGFKAYTGDKQGTFKTLSVR